MQVLVHQMVILTLRRYFQYTKNDELVQSRNTFIVYQVCFLPLVQFNCCQKYKIDAIWNQKKENATSKYGKRRIDTWNQNSLWLLVSSIYLSYYLLKGAFSWILEQLHDLVDSTHEINGQSLQKYNWGGQVKIVG